MEEVEDRIRKDHSPEQIAGRLKLEHPEDTSWHISHETIYQHVYARIKEGADLQAHLRQSGKKRKKRTAKKDNRGVIPNRVFIDKRPEIVDSKTQAGHWEGDTVEGGDKKGYILTYVERKTKYTLARRLANKSAENVVKASRGAFKDLPEAMKKTITLDNGKEFAKHEALAKVTGSTVYFAHPYHSWERGLNEHTNGKLRQYYPKKQPLDKLSSHDLAIKVRMLNNRPRKSLGYQTPQEAFTQELFALQT
jgi:IS30 family transposase